MPVIDDSDPRDIQARDRFFWAFPGPIGYGPLPDRAARITRALATHATVVPAMAG